MPWDKWDKRMLLLSALGVTAVALGLLTGPQAITAQDDDTVTVEEEECVTHTHRWVSWDDGRTEFSIDGGTPWHPVFRVTPVPRWADPIPGSSWISVSADRLGRPAASGPTQARYRSQFTVQGPYLHSQVVAVRVHADNQVTVSLNGQVFGQQPSGNPPANFQDPPEAYGTVSGLQVGNNVLGFLVNNEPDTVTGLDYWVSVWHRSCDTPPTGPPDSVPGLG